MQFRNLSSRIPPRSATHFLSARRNGARSTWPVSTGYRCDSVPGCKGASNTETVPMPSIFVGISQSAVLCEMMHCPVRQCAARYVFVPRVRRKKRSRRRVLSADVAFASAACGHGLAHPEHSRARHATAVPRHASVQSATNRTEPADSG